MPAEIAEIVSVQREWEDREWFPPGPQLAVCLSGGKERLADLTDEELLQVAKAARRQTSWAQARELAAIAELTQRRTADEDAGDPDYRILSAHESVTEEVAAALTVTGNAAATLVHLAEQLTGPLVRTGEALGAGHIDMAKARVICDVVDGLPELTAMRVECAALEKATEQTTGQLRRRIKRIAQRLAPEAIEERKREAVRQRRLELWDTPSGTTDLAVCDLRAEDAHAIYNKITAAARGIAQDGDTRPLNTIRADLATQLLHGTELPDAVRALLVPPSTYDQAADHGTTSPKNVQDTPPVGERSLDGHSGASGIHSLTSAVSRCLGHVHDQTPTPGLPSAPKSVKAAPGGLRTAGRGVASDLEVSLLADMVDRRLEHVRRRTRPADLPAAVGRAALHIQQQFIEAREVACRGDDDVHGRPGYRPPAVLRREVEARHATCVFPTCNQPSHRCDLDHTIPWRPGTTCRCNLAPLCRRHHRLKQSPGWKLHQIWPGLLVWVTPSGAWHIIRPDRQ